MIQTLLRSCGNVRWWMMLFCSMFAIVRVPSCGGTVYAGFDVGREFSYLGKYCFDYNTNFSQVVGWISGQIHTPIDGLKLAIYDDEDAFWNYIMYNHSCDCNCKISSNHTKYVYDVTRASDEEAAFKFNFTIREHLRPRFWYVALAKCVNGGDSFVPSFTQLSEANFAKYFFTAWFYVHMQQADGSEVPVYQQGLTTVFGIFTVLALIATILQSYAAKTLHKSESFHPIMKLLTSIVWFYFISNLFLFLDSYVFEINGIGLPLLSCIANITEVFVRVATLLLALLIAKGWTINSVVLEGQEKLTCLIASLLMLYLSLAMWYLVWLNPASTLYLYDSFPGIGICLIQVVVVIWFMSTIFHTRNLEDMPQKRQFFNHMLILFTIYMLSLPVIVIIASFVSPWVREKIVTSVIISIEFITYSILIYLLWPSRAPKYFERLYSLCSESEKANLFENNLPSDEL